MAKAADGLLGFLSEVDNFFLEKALDAAQGAVDILDFPMVEGFSHNAGEAGIEGGIQTAVLGYKQISREFFGHEGGIG
jgi:hypothetical protein